MSSGGNFTEFYCVENGVRRPAGLADLEAVGAWGSNGPPPIKEEHRAAKRQGGGANGGVDGGVDGGADMDVDVDPNGNPNGNPNAKRKPPNRRINFD
jgi:hypothetical protein